MDGRIGIPLVLFAGAAIVLGIAWGAATQQETFIGNQVDDNPSIGSDVTILTAFFVGVGITVLLAALGTAPRRQRITGALVGGASAWLLTFLVQSAWPNYIVLPMAGSASILQSNLLLESTGAPSVLLPVLALGILLMAGLGWAIQAVRVKEGSTPSLSAVRRDHLAIAALAVPALIVTAAGMIRVMLELPDDIAGAGLVTVLNPLAAVGCVLLAVTVSLRAHYVARLRHDPDRTWPTIEAWRTFDRIDMAGIAAILLVAVLSTFLDKSPADITSAGPTLLFTPRSHGQAILFLGVVLVPLYILHRRIEAVLPLARNEPAPIGQRADRTIWIFVAVIGASSALGFILTFAVGKALLPWLVALVPAAIVAGIFGRPASSALVRVVAAWTLWGEGNTIIAAYQANRFPDLEFFVHPGILALWRLMAAALLAWVVFDILHAVGSRERQRVVVPLALAAAVGTGLFVLLEFPLNVWAESTVPVDRVAVGSLVRSQQTGVQVVMHLLATTAVVGAVAATARLLRPDWFRRRRAATTDATVTATPG